MDQVSIMDEMRSAIKKGDVHAATQLMSSFPQLINETSFFGTWLHQAATQGNLSIVEQLVERGADVNRRGGVAGGTAINEAASEGHFDVVKYLFDHGASLDADAPERDVLFGAIYARHVAMAKFLIDHGVNFRRSYDCGPKKSRSALKFAIEFGCTEIADYLRSKGATSDTAPSKQSSPSLAESIVAYFSAEFGKVEPLSLQRIIEFEGPPIQIHVINPTNERQSRILFTTGMSAQAMEVPVEGDHFQFAELMIELPPDWPLSMDALQDSSHRWPFDWLRQIAQYPHQAKIWLGGEITIVTNEDPPEPLGPGVGFSSILLIADHLGCGPVICEDRTIHIYTLIPLYAEEKNLEVAEGMSRLLKRLDQFGVERSVRIDRPNVAVG